ncbi:16S rRNA (guanine(527)-N(7))-methyltransferase RsmG [Kamptonema sp. UHCC 0994]|uniref:16S rRNA (guanine(527)-N(7))-methyltransferase RsmG n=1 Tax=Kamptonema sp. UHCC 0994 TaxID=3031329 RepID=UPI0023B8C76B|nr:16S rRNA (guanine(527)-N(7))-methyltransferase RsmG [Kamptonema sp. UHCC 0994]MDF0551582.1 16S rRNA (guanine(527)-N(7))-methyltransferase RsmG [Kamptonema sp. UHCC 0994]
MFSTVTLPEMNELWQETLSWQPSDEQQQQFQRLYELIIDGNKHLNLTRITEPLEFWEKHLWDSLRGIAPLLSPNRVGVIDELPLKSMQKVIDIGTGAGFPGLPVALALPKLTVTLLDGTRKKISFLENLVPQIGIKNAVPLIGRSEEIAYQPQHRQSYDLAFLRAVASASICAKYSLPLLKTGGLAILYRGNWTVEEEVDLQSVVEELGGAIAQVEAFTTPLSQSVRHCVYLRKDK